MKKYHPNKLLLILFILITIGALFGVLLVDGWKRIVILICTFVMIFAFVLCTTYFIQFQNDKVIIRHGLSSFNKSYRSNFKTRCFLICDIADISINYSSSYVIIELKDGNNILLSLGGYFNASEIIDEFKTVQNKLT